MKMHLNSKKKKKEEEELHGQGGEKNEKNENIFAKLFYTGILFAFPSEK